jgi:hypothetical protein
MNLKKELAWAAVSTAVAIVAASAARKVLTAGWEKASGQPPPTGDTAEASWTTAVLWAAAIGASVGVARVVAQRSAAEVWEKAVGEPIPTAPTS